MLIAATALLAACASEPEEFSATPSAGSSAGSGSSGNLAALPAQDPRSQEWLTENVGDRVFFEFDQSDLSPQSQETVEKLVAWMQSYPDVTLTLEGHADERGTREYNLALGERRANSVRSYMEALGIDGARLSTISFGKERPAVLGSNEAAWAQNRRAVFVVN
jgi:peptidoglycan-associated lipoprotein